MEEVSSTDPGNNSQPDDDEARTTVSSLWELEVVDMNNEYMDPLEWTVRKVIPIPKQYFWEAENVQTEELPIKLKVWHRSVAAMGSVVRFVDRLGKPVVGFFGLTNSRFEYVTSTMTEEDWEYSRRQVQERRNLQQQEDMETQEQHQQS
jgi:hypothetical protein